MTTPAQPRINPFTGIAVGMATNIPPHNLNAITAYPAVYYAADGETICADCVNFWEQERSETVGLVRVHVAMHVLEAIDFYDAEEIIVGVAYLGWDAKIEGLVRCVNCETVILDPDPEVGVCFEFAANH